MKGTFNVILQVKMTKKTMKSTITLWDKFYKVWDASW